MNEYFEKGFHALDQIDVPEERKAALKEFAQYLIDRDR